MLTKKSKENLEKQHYKVVGKHSAVKICGWTAKMLRNEGSCYKHKFYGIKSNQCMQMSTSLSCANRCIFCWRDYKAPVSKKWKWEIDEPELILEGALRGQRKLLSGFGGYLNLNKKYFEESKYIKHVALSLTGEPIIYPKINEFVKLLKKNKLSIFLVTKGQYPEQIKNLDKVTQLYLSVDAPTKELLKKIDKPLFKDYWERLEKSLEYLSKRKERTCIRLTLIKNINDKNPEKYAELIKKGNPDFIEVKSYMFLGASRERLKEENMPLHEDVVEFSKELKKYLKDYEIISEHIPSRVVLFAKKKFKRKNKWYTWIDFDSGKNKLTPETGISGLGTLNYKEQTSKLEM